jgi:hypothetical protein
MDDQERIAALEQALRDAAGQRDAAQRRAAQQADKAEIWQQRAEERAERIDRIVAERDQLRSAPGWLRAKIGRTMNPPPERVSPTSPPATAAATPTARPIAFPTVRVAALVDDPLVETVLAETSAVALTDEPTGFEGADLVVIEGDALAGAEDSLRVRFEEWMGSLARAPLVLIEGEGSTTLADSDVAARRAWTENGDSRDWALPPTFDAVRFNPRHEFDPADFVEGSGIAETEAGDFGQPFDPGRPWMLAAAATGFPFSGVIDTADALRSGVAVRRIAFRDNAPWIVVAQLLDRAGIGHESPLPAVAGILISMRPDRVAEAARRFADQTYPRKQLVIGCHRFGTDRVAEVVADLEGQLPIRVMAFDESVPLGRCLNLAIDTAPASLIAKIDDDDFYGPNYLEDAVQANRYARAPLVGKGATFTYLENRGETLLRRPKISDRFYDGSPSGASLVFERNLWERVPFPHRTLGEDLAFVEGAKLLGIRPYATSPFEFVYYRGVSGNTWEAVDEVFLEGAVPAWDGYRPEMAVIDA